MLSIIVIFITKHEGGGGGGEVMVDGKEYVTHVTVAAAKILLVVSQRY